jgi:hypothetical protein
MYQLSLLTSGRYLGNIWYKNGSFITYLTFTYRKSVSYNVRISPISLNIDDNVTEAWTLLPTQHCNIVHTIQMQTPQYMLLTVTAWISLWIVKENLMSQDLKSISGFLGTFLYVFWALEINFIVPAANVFKSSVRISTNSITLNSGAEKFWKWPPSS